jgi:hypothetical protein
MAKHESARQAVRVWLATHDKTQDWLAAAIGTSSGQLSYVLRGFRPLTKEMAEDIRTATGGLNLTAFVTEPAHAEVRS